MTVRSSGSSRFRGTGSGIVNATLHFTHHKFLFLRLLMVLLELFGV